MNERCGVEKAFERALEQIQARVSVLAPGKTVSLAVAYSGGLDSSVLLHLACRHAKRQAIQVHALHVHHGLSPNADDWLQHCRTEAGRMGAQFDAAYLHVSAESIRQHGTEQAARIARYRALSDLCRVNRVRLLLAAHHQDDQAETLMLQLLRGAGLPGLSGMALLQTEHALLDSGLALGRPLLELSRASIEDYAHRHALHFVVDESNSDVIYRRNALRHEVLPVLRKHFPGADACIARSATHIRAAQDLLQELAAIDLEQCRDEHDAMALNRVQLAALSPQRCDNLIRHWLRGLGLPMPSTARLDQLRVQLLEAGPDRQPLLEFGAFSLSRAGRSVVLRPNLGGIPAREVVLQWKGEAEIPIAEWHGALLFEPVQDGGIGKQQLLAARLAVRARRGQERLKIAPNRPSKTLKNLYQEAGVPAWQREWLPLIYQDQELVFAAGLGMDVRNCAGPGIALRWRSDWPIVA